MPVAVSTAVGHAPEITNDGFARQRMNKSGTFSANTTRRIVTGRSSDAANPAVIVGDKLVVQGDGPSTITARAVGPGGGGNNVHAYLVLDGTTIATYDAYGSAFNAPPWSIPRTLSNGDEVWIEATADSFATLTINVGAYIEVVPQ
ncbi:hypothetical protein L5G28_00910 [Gordonia sp. HY285]|nr:hypothetical protein [Gordonia liuliyuniae]